MKLLLLVTTLSSWAFLAQSQTMISGRVRDNQQYLPSVNVVVLQDSLLVKAAVTDSLGAFSIENISPGNYLLQASMVGYATYSWPFTLVRDQKVPMDIPEILLEEHRYALKEVVIGAQKQLIDQKADRTVINLGGSITAAGNNVLEVLQKSPGVVVNKQSNTIAVNGNVGVRIMINEKLLQVPAEAAIQILEGMGASNVERIELITSPGANHDADGTGGIIHIVTKENPDYGTSGSAVFTVGAHWAETLGTAINLSSRNRKSAYFLDYSILRNHNLHNMNMQRYTMSEGFLQTMFDESRRENVTTLQNFSMGGEWNLTKNTTLNILFTAYRSNWNLKAIASHVSHIAADSTSVSSTNVTESNIWQSAIGSVGIGHQLTANSRIEIGLDYLFYHNSNPSRYAGIAPSSADIDLAKETPIYFLVGTVNFRNANKATGFSWATGVKAVTSSLRNRVVVNRYEANEWIQDPVFSSHSTMHEQVGAAYVTAQWPAIGRWTINSGLRFEYTHTSIPHQPKMDPIKRKYGYFFPTISTNKKLESGAEVNVSYARRLTRPTYNDIAPYVFFWGPHSFSAGNASLYPALSDAMSVGYLHRAWSITLQYTHTQRAITTMQPEIDRELNSLVYKSQNLKYLNTIALTYSYAIHLAPWWETQATIIGQYQNARSTYLPNNVGWSLFGVNVNVVNRINLENGFSLEVSGVFQSRTLSGISHFLPFGSLHAGAQKKFGRSNTLRLSIDDAFYTNTWRIRTRSPENNLNVNFNYDFHNQFVRLTYTWTLGNTKPHVVKINSESKEERGRVSH